MRRGLRAEVFVDDVCADSDQDYSAKNRSPLAKLSSTMVSDSGASKRKCEGDAAHGQCHFEDGNFHECQAHAYG